VSSQLHIDTAAVEALMIDGKMRTPEEISQEIGRPMAAAIAAMFNDGRLAYIRAAGVVFYEMNTEHLAALKMLEDGNL
jgi:hypothetical protein